MDEMERILWFILLLWIACFMLLWFLLHDKETANEESSIPEESDI